jgi:hypothetical protein
MKLECSSLVYGIGLFQKLVLDHILELLTVTQRIDLVLKKILFTVQYISCTITPRQTTKKSVPLN